MWGEDGDEDEEEEGEGSRDVMVRQVPFMLMLSPRVASWRSEAQLLMVREVPEPPEVVSSCWVRLLTALE